MGKTEVVRLDEVAREPWAHVATTEATLVVAEDSEFDSALVSAAESVAGPVSLEDSAVADDHREQYACSPAIESPQIETGTTLAGSDIWHGQRLATEAESVVDAYNAGTYATTECEGFGVAVACDRFGMLDRYLSVRAASNFDRPPEDGSIDPGWRMHGPAFENMYRVGRAIADEIATDWEHWKDGPPSAEMNSGPKVLST